jgi:hypothetical protein
VQRTVLTLTLCCFAWSCRTSNSDADSGLLTHSAGRDARLLEDGIAGYRIELDRFEVFEGQIDYANFYEDVDTHSRTNFVVFRGRAGTECTVGLTNEEMSHFKSHPRLKFDVKTTRPGLAKGLYQSQLVMSYAREGTATPEEVLVVCTQPNRRVSVTDASTALGGFLLFVADGKDTPTYDVCCRCKVDTISAARQGETAVAKDEVRYYLMRESNDSICRRHFDPTVKTVLRPGDPHFMVNDARYSVTTGCDEAAMTSCEAQMSAAASAVGPSTAALDDDKATSAP